MSTIYDVKYAKKKLKGPEQKATPGTATQRGAAHQQVQNVQTFETGLKWKSLPNNTVASQRESRTPEL
ncbi:hypothetical protein Hamer_G028819 [Homarus americanus]|uniref:Uncharacterized protein n=1 Tax=Homarus americanus TaxID=6706 RepID=A0A8J5JD05_HOMAM|nr:hypothetical protein Hamer_G028819 [Homarus americanus]